MWGLPGEPEEEPVHPLGADPEWSPGKARKEAGGPFLWGPLRFMFGSGDRTACPGLQKKGPFLSYNQVDETNG